MTTCHRSLVIALALSSSILAGAESTGTHISPSRSASPILAVLDSDHNGMLSAREIAAAPVTLTALDLNQDGMISPDELQAFHANGRAARSSRGPGLISFNVVFTLDANHDGEIQPMEIANAVSSLKRLDRNGDGQLTHDELRPVLVASNRT
jgi:hypothetical protein